MGSRGANKANKFGGKYCVIFICKPVLYLLDDVSSFSPSTWRDIQWNLSLKSTKLNEHLTFFSSPTWLPPHFTLYHENLAEEVNSLLSPKFVPLQNHIFFCFSCADEMYLYPSGLNFKFYFRIALRHLRPVFTKKISKSLIILPVATEGGNRDFHADLGLQLRAKNPGNVLETTTFTLPVELKTKLSFGGTM